MKPPELVVRRSRLIAGLTFAMAAILAVAAIWYAISVVRAGEVSWLGAGLVVTLLVFYAIQTGAQLRDDTPLAAIGPEGLRVPRASAAPIAWSEIRRVGASRSFSLNGGGRLDVEVVPEAFARLKLGNRLFGDAVVKMVGAPFGFSLLAQGFDHRASDMLAAIGRHWPPPAPDDDADPGAAGAD
ncbi:MAG: hypothetical protein JNK67_22090 [Alphaproteobacteria bacterium]|nr:hypothetical protein [Alphaproteobacteria bacterium]